MGKQQRTRTMSMKQVARSKEQIARSKKQGANSKNQEARNKVLLMALREV